ncbi:MAG: hypothetical protein QOH57_317 [Mycobacterium sp.]|nr:hypothetical protein [Mycobacterium sp.]
MWTALSVPGVAAVALGAAFGAVAVNALQRSRAGKFVLAAVNASVCGAAGVLVMVMMQWPHFPVLVVVGLVGAAAPLTMTLPPAEPMDTVAEAVRYLRRAAAAMTINLVYGIAAATVGFVGAMTVVLAIVGST